MFFMPQRTAYAFCPRDKGGGWGIEKRAGWVTAPHSLNSFVFLWFVRCYSDSMNDDPEKFRGDDSDPPPPKGGFPTDPDSGALWHASIPARRGSLSSVFIPAGRLGKDALGAGRIKRRMALWN